MYGVLTKYPEHFNEQSIAMPVFTWVYVLLTNRCFASPWYNNSHMVPFADFINHENVDVYYECCDMEGKAIPESRKAKKA